MYIKSICFSEEKNMQRTNQEMEKLTKIFEYDLSELQQERIRLEELSKYIEQIKTYGSVDEKKNINSLTQSFDSDKSMLSFELQAAANNFVTKCKAIYGSPQSPSMDIKTSISSIITLNSFFLYEILKNAFDIRAT